MPDILWPSTLQSKVEADSFSLDIGDSTIRTDMDIGPAKIRRRFTKQIDTYSVSIILTSSLYQTFLDFFRLDLNGGVNQFVFNHPITGTATYYRFLKPPSFKSLGGNVFGVSMNWESVP